MNEDQIEQSTVTKTKFSWLRIGNIVLIIVVVAAVVAGIWLAVTSRPIKIAWAGVVHNRRENYLDCQHLPFYGQVLKAFSQHGDVVTKVKAIPGITDFKPELDKCYIYTGGIQFLKSQAVLEYNSRAARSQAEAIIGKDFFGMAYRGEPVK